MNVKTALAIGLIPSTLLMGASLAQAHSALKSFSPANGATITEEPAKLELQFTSPLLLTYVALTPQGQESLSLEVPERQLQADYALPLPALEPNHYSVEWRSMSKDGHNMKGNFEFNLKKQ
ncbi:copper resistance CopC family protein [Modicisalibacter zincidurans]|uniref:CopC domain-containing protein n=2 Tax=Halomonadaceae TaxID=28256 RepID=A0ABP9R7X0_9GAMM|nr:copper resistance CopC family protein [Halomonas zincidurans]